MRNLRLFSPSTHNLYPSLAQLITLKMAEPFGIAAGAVGIVTAFTACIDCFEYIQFGRHFGRDFQTDQLALSCARLRLTRWGESVDIYNDPRLGKPNATTTEIQVAKDTLLQILVLFADTEGISKKYKIAAKAGEDLSAFATGDMDPTLIALDNKMNGPAIQRQKGSRFLKLTSWALYHRSELKDRQHRKTFPRTSSPNHACPTRSSRNRRQKVS
jgi:hypothetical protein